MIRDLLADAVVLGLTFTGLGVLAVLLNEGPVGLRHPFELTGLLGNNRVKAVLPHVFILFGLLCLAASLPLAALQGFGYK